MRRVTSSDGVVVAVHEHGGSGRPILMCHATGFHGAVWEPLSASLGDGFERFALDFRAHGSSTAPEGLDLRWSGTADDVLSVVDAIGGPPGSVLGVGHSMGGAALLLAEQARPGTFAALWLFEPIVPPPGAPVPSEGANHLAESALRRQRSFASRDEALARFASKPPLSALRADALHAYVRHGLVPAGDGTGLELACRPEDESEIYRGGGSHGAFDQLGEVACPVVVACGDDQVGPAAFAAVIADQLPDGRLERHHAVGHFGPLEAPPRMAAAVRALAASLA